jgi:hypothetical protein
MPWYKFHKFYHERRGRDDPLVGYDWVHYFYEHVEYEDGAAVLTVIDCLETRPDIMLVDYDAKGWIKGTDDRYHWHCGRQFYTKEAWINKFVIRWKNFVRRKKAARKIQQFLLEVIYRPGHLGYQRACSGFGTLSTSATTK